MKVKNNIDQITSDMASYVCDELCKYPCEIKDVEKLEDICCECKMAKFIADIINTHNKKRG